MEKKAVTWYFWGNSPSRAFPTFQVKSQIN